LDEIKPNIRVWWSDGTQPIQLLLNNSVTLTSAWYGRIYASDQARKETGFAWDGAAQELDYWIVPRGSPNQKIAALFILFSSLPQTLGKQTEMVGYGPANTSALLHVSDAARPQLPTYPSNWQVSFVVNADWWAANEEQLKTRWINWKGK
jgi:putative spermidine/putrescine transport system substrate-binding protein